jgi:hypothetical protein
LGAGLVAGVPFTPLRAAFQPINLHAVTASPRRIAEYPFAVVSQRGMPLVVQAG